MAAQMVQHQGKRVRRGDATLTTTLCGRANKRSSDGMNIADRPEQVTCKFCLKALARPVKEAR